MTDLVECPHCLTKVIMMHDSTCPACGENPNDELVSRDRQQALRSSREQVALDTLGRDMLERRSVLERLKSGESKQSILDDYRGTGSQLSVMRLLSNHPVRQTREKYRYLNWILSLLFVVVVGLRLYFSAASRQFQFESTFIVIQYAAVIMFSLWTLYLMASWNRVGYSLAGCAAGFAMVSDLQYYDEIIAVTGNSLLYFHIATSLGCVAVVLSSLYLLFGQSNETLTHPNHITTD